MRSLEEIKEENGDQPAPKEEKKQRSFLEGAKDWHCKKDTAATGNYNELCSIACSLIFIGEQLEKIANAMENNDVSLDEAVKIWGVPK